MMDRDSRRVSEAWLLLAVVLCGCGSSAAAVSPDKGVAENETAAAAADRQASMLCQGGRGTVCWSDRNSSAAKKLHQSAARHRAAAVALQEAETRACEGVSAEDRDTSPFFHGADIRSVSELREGLNLGATRLAGATVVFRAVPGLTAEWLQRLLDCHLARNAAVGYDMPEMADCPLAVRGVKVTVVSAGDGFAVELASDNDAVAAEVLRRAQKIPVAPS